MDSLTAEQAKQIAIDAVARNADPQWVQAALKAVETICGMIPTFTADEVWAYFEVYHPDIETPEKRALGAVMRHAVRQGWCEPTGDWRKSRRKECHARPVQVWRSRSFKWTT